MCLSPDGLRTFWWVKRGFTECSTLGQSTHPAKRLHLDLRDICDAKIMGADCVLLIVAALEKRLLAEFIEFSEDLNLAALVETHDEAEVEIALDSEQKMIGINQRDLKTFKVDQKRALRVISEIPEHIIRVAESGIRALSDAEPLKPQDSTVLIGESLVMSDFPEELLHNYATSKRNLYLRNFDNVKLCS